MTFSHMPVGLVELLILYARVQFYTPRASDYRLISKTVFTILINLQSLHKVYIEVEDIRLFIQRYHVYLYGQNQNKVFFH